MSRFDFPASTRRARWLAAARGASERLRGYTPVTPLGALATAGAVLLVRNYAIGQDDLVAAVLGWVAIALLGTCFVAVVLGLLLLAFALRDLPPSSEVRMETEGEVPTGFSLPSLAWLPLAQVDFRVDVPGLASRVVAEDFRLKERLSANRRGVHPAITRRVSVGDAFGLTEVAWSVVEPSGVVVEPHLGMLARMPTLLSLSAGDAVAHPSGAFEGDRVDVRRYSPGDAARHIHWRVLARTRKLVVRVQERAIAPSSRVVAYQVAGPDDEASAAAALAAVRHGALGADWRFGADGTPRPTRDRDEAAFAVVRSAEFRHDGGQDLDAFLRTCESDGPVGLVLFLPPRVGAWTERVLRLLADRGTPVHVVIGVDGLAQPEVRSRLGRFALRPRPERRVTSAELETLREKLVAVRADVTVVDRPSGRVLVSGRSVTPDLTERAA